jgi:hypothetical protein
MSLCPRRVFSWSEVLLEISCWVRLLTTMM